MIVLMTDFGREGPYLGQVEAVLARFSPGHPVVTLFSDLPPFAPKPAAYLLPAYCQFPFDAESIFVCVVDPGVGTARKPIILHLDDRWFVGPDNGLFEIVLRRCVAAQVWEILWSPPNQSATFHGRDIFAPIAAFLANGARPGYEGFPQVNALAPEALERQPWPDDLAEVVYIDHFGNVMTGVRGDCVSNDDHIEIKGQDFSFSPTYGGVAPGDCFWYRNSNGLIEIAVSGEKASDVLGLSIGDAVALRRGV